MVTSGMVDCAVAQEGRLPGYYPTTEEVGLMGGESREMYRRARGGLRAAGPDAGSLTASGLWRQDPEPTDSFWERHENIFSPIDSTLGYLVPGEVLLWEGTNDEIRRSQIYGYTDPGFPLTRDFNPDLAMFKLGPLYLDLISLSGTVLYSDFNGTAGGDPGDDDGWLSSINLAFRGVARLTENLYLSATGEIYYLPGTGDVGFFFGNGSPSNLRLAYENSFADGRWDYIIYNDFSARHRLSDLFDNVEHNEIDTAGRYRFGRAENSRASDWWDDDSVFFVNITGAGITGELTDIIQASSSFEHINQWRTFDFDHTRRWDRFRARLDFYDEHWRFIPFVEYSLTAQDDWSDLYHTLWGGVRARISENLRGEAKVGYYTSTGTGNDSHHPTWELGLVHDLTERTVHSFYAGQRHVLTEDDFDNLFATYARYTIAHRFGSRLYGSAFAQWGDYDNLERVNADKEVWTGGLRLTGDISDYTRASLGAYYDEWNYSGPGRGSERWVYRASVRQRLLPYLYARFLYQYEDYSSRGPTNYDEHLYMLTVTHLF